jgi:hypothetical protein
METKDIMIILGIIAGIVTVGSFLGLVIYPVYYYPPGSTPTPTLTPAPTPSPTPTPPFGVPHTGGPWRVTIDDAYKETKVTTVILNKTYASPSGYIFLVVNASFLYLGPTPMNISAMDVTVISEDGEILDFYASGMPEIWFVGSQIRFRSWEHNHVRFILVFVLREDDIDQVFTLKFQEVPPTCEEKH